MRYCCKCHFCVNLSKKLGMQMQEGFANEGRRRQEDNRKEITERMDEGFRKEERARKLVQNDLAITKEEIKIL